jgi:hypothetical protein
MASFAQNNKSIFKIDTNFFGKKTFTVFANRTFGKLATGQNTANLANFGSLDPTAGSFNFNAFTPISFSGEESKKFIPYLSLEAKGDLASDKSTIIFSNSKLNTNVDASIKLHLPLPWFNNISFYKSENDKLFLQKIKLQQEYDIRLDEADTTLKLQSIKRDRLNWELNNKRRISRLDRDTLRIYLDSLNKLKARRNPDTAEIVKVNDLYKKRLDTLAVFRRDSVRLASEISQIDKILGLPSGQRRNHVRRVTRVLRKEFEDSLQKVELAAPITGARFMWITLTGTFNKKKYFEYDTMLAFENRINKRELTAFNYGVEFHYFKQFVRHAHYFNIGLARRKDNNIKELSTSKLSQSIPSASNGIEREVTSEYSVYTDSIIEFKSKFFYANYYFMFNKSALSAVHLFPDYDRRNNGNHLWNLGIGYVISVVDKKSDKSTVNFEAYYKFLDMGNELESDKKFLERNEIGIRVGFPLGFVLNNK